LSPRLRWLQPRTREAAELAEEFNVDLRTAQRDLNERLAHVDLVKLDGCYELDVRRLGKLSTQDIERFAVLGGIAGLFPSLGHRFVQATLQ
jgi:predicted DNA-binding transcriptional regulator YafY